MFRKTLPNSSQALTTNYPGLRAALGSLCWWRGNRVLMGASSQAAGQYKLVHSSDELRGVTHLRHSFACCWQWEDEIKTSCTQVLLTASLTLWYFGLLSCVCSICLLPPSLSPLCAQLSLKENMFRNSTMHISNSYINLENGKTSYLMSFFLRSLKSSTVYKITGILKVSELISL